MSDELGLRTLIARKAAAEEAARLKRSPPLDCWNDHESFDDPYAKFDLGHACLNGITIVAAVVVAGIVVCAFWPAVEAFFLHLLD